MNSLEFFWEREADFLDKIIKSLKNKLELETCSSILSYFCCFYIPEYKQEYFDFISKIDYFENEYFYILNDPLKEWSLLKIFRNVVGTLLVLHKGYRYTFLYTPFTEDDFYWNYK